jgi:hypothetical protein
VVAVTSGGDLANISIEIPDNIASRLEAHGEDLARRALGALALQAYHAGEIAETEVQTMLCLSSRWVVEALLKRAHAYLDYDEADLKSDVAAIRRVSPGLS